MKRLTLLPLLLLLAGFALSGDTDKRDVDLSEPLETLTPASLQARAVDPFGNPMPDAFFAEPVPALAEDLGYVAHLVYDPATLPASVPFTLYSLDGAVRTAVTVEVRDAKGVFVAKHLVLLDPEDAVAVDLGLDPAAAWQVGFYAGANFGLAGTVDRQARDLPVRPPVLTLEKTHLSGYLNCAAVSKTIHITNSGGTAVTAYATATAVKGIDMAYRQYLRVNYPDPWTAFHKALVIPYGPFCTAPVAYVDTSRNTNAMFGTHRWYDPYEVLELGAVGSVRCESFSICGTQSWTWQVVP